MYGTNSHPTSSQLLQPVTDRRHICKVSPKPLRSDRLQISKQNRIFRKVVDFLHLKMVCSINVMILGGNATSKSCNARIIRLSTFLAFRQVFFINLDKRGMGMISFVCGI